MGDNTLKFWILTKDEIFIMETDGKAISIHKRFALDTSSKWKLILNPEIPMLLSNEGKLFQFSPNSLPYLSPSNFPENKKIKNINWMENSEFLIK